MPGPDKWAYPWFDLLPEQHCPSNAIGVAFTFTVLGGTARFHVRFDEKNGSSYLADFLAVPRQAEAVETLALFANASWGAWSQPDPNSHLDPEQIVSFKIGCNSEAAQVKFMIKNVRWIVR